MHERPCMFSKSVAQIYINLIDLQKESAIQANLSFEVSRAKTILSFDIPNNMKYEIQ